MFQRNLLQVFLNEVKSFETNPKTKKEGIKRIIEKINNAKYSTGSDLDILDKVKIGHGEKVSTYSTKDAIDAMIKYSNDAIALNKHLEKLDEAAAEDFKNSSIAKKNDYKYIYNGCNFRCSCCITKNFYIRSSVAPGARTAMQMKEAKDNSSQNKVKLLSKVKSLVWVNWVKLYPNYKK